MADMKYHLVTTDTGVFQIHWGTVRADEKDVEKKAISERWVPKDWVVIGSFSDEKSANKALEKKIQELVDADKKKELEKKELEK